MSKPFRCTCEKCGTLFRSKQKGKKLCHKCASPKWIIIPEDKMKDKNILIDN